MIEVIEMKKTFTFYAIIWILLLAVFNVICFVTPNEMFGFEKIDSTFWVAYAFITAAFVGQLVCAYIAFKAENLKKLFYNLPLISVSYTGLIVMLVVGAATMLIPYVPNWVGSIVCFIVLAFTAIAVVKAKGVSDVVSKIDEKVKVNTAFIKKQAVLPKSVVSHIRKLKHKLMNNKYGTLFEELLLL